MARDHKIFYDAPPIGSVSVLAKMLDLSEPRITKIANAGEDYYIVFTKSVKGKTRELAEPKPDLKILQKRIISRIFCNLRFPRYLHGGIKASTPRDFLSNAKEHAGAETAITLDIKSYYPSITYEQVFHSFQHLFDFPVCVATILTKLTTLNGSLPQGSPTSSYIANFVIWEREYKLAAKLEHQGYVYSRLIDDITVSSSKPISPEKSTRIVTEIIGMLKSYNFVAHPDKTNVYSRSNPEKLMVVTGLWLNRGAPRLAASKRNQISKEAADIVTAAGTDRTSEKFHENYARTSGKVALLQRLKHVEASRLRVLLDNVTPIYDDVQVLKVRKLVEMFCKKSPNHSNLGYLKRFYKMQYYTSIIRKTHPKLATTLQALLNKRRPKTIMRELNG